MKGYVKSVGWALWLVAPLFQACGSEDKVKKVGLKPLDVREGTFGDATSGGDGTGKDSVSAFASSLHQPLQDYCGACHAKVQPPLFASPDKKTAHDALVETAKVDFKDIEQSRIVLRVAKENHNCPGGDCEKAASDFVKGIQNWIAGMNDGGRDREVLPRTSALMMSDGIEGNAEDNSPPGVIYLEAESGVIKAPMVSVSSADARGGLMIHTPSGAGNQNNAATAINQANLGTITFTFNVKKAGSYVLFGRVGSPVANANGFYMRANNSVGLETWQFPQTNNNLIWDRADGAVGASTPIAFNFVEGVNTFEIRQRRERARIDTLVFALDLNFDPDTAWQNEQAVRKLSFDLSAQTGISGAAFTVAVAEYSDNSYVFRNPTVVLPVAHRVKVKNVRLLINDKFLPQHATFSHVDTEVTAENGLLSHAALVALKDKGDDQDQFSFEFEVLQKLP